MKSMVHLWTASPDDGAIHGLADCGGGIWEYANNFHLKIQQCPLPSNASKFVTFKYGSETHRFGSFLSFLLGKWYIYIG